MMARAGFTWFRCYPIIFCSGTGVAGRYHADASDVVAWQVYGSKVFNGFHDPYDHLPLSDAVDPGQRTAIVKPNPVPEGEVLHYRMNPGDVLWNQIITPHWVDAGADQPALSFNISHGGLRLDGALSRHGAALEQRYQKFPESRF